MGKTKIIPRIGQLLLLAVMAVFLFLYLQGSQEFTYFYREQHQLLQWDGVSLQKMILPIGGFCKFLGQALVQFFVLPKMGALITTLLCLISAHGLWSGLKKICSSWWLTPLAFIPSVLYNLYLLDNYAHYEGLVALVLMSLCFWLHTALGGLNKYLQLGITSVAALLLYYLAGPVAVLFTLAVLIYEAVKHFKQAVWYCIPLGLVLLGGLLAVNRAYIPTLGQAYWMNGYVDYFFQPNALYSYSWLSALALIPVFWLLGKLKPMNMVVEGVAGLLLAVIIGYAYKSMSEIHQDKGMYDLERAIYLSDTEQWDTLLNLPYDETNNLIILNYMNLALCQKGELQEKLFRIPQANGTQSLFMDYQQYTDIGMMRAKTYYQIGAIGASQMMAVSALMSVADGAPSMVKLIVKNYLITGKHSVAAKYLRQLENSWYYKDWAASMKKFLNNEKEIQQDPELGFKRKDLPLNNEYFTIYAGLMNDASTVLDANPEEKSALDYLIGYLLLEKNFNYIKPFVEYNYGKPWLKELPVRMQEAVLAYSEHDMDYCRQYGVSEEMIQKWAEFRQDALQVRHSGGSNSQLAQRWGDTFWYYMLKGGSQKQ